MKLYLLIGNPGTRKSSLVRALTGAFNRSLRDIQLDQKSGSPLRVYVRGAALQSSKTSPEAFVQEVRSRGQLDALLLCLTPQADPIEPERYPDAAQYLAQFKAAGWKLERAAATGQDAGPLKGALLLRLPFATSQPVNLSAKAVRQHFGWV